MRGLIRLAIEAGPLAVFFIANARADIVRDSLVPIFLEGRAESYVRELDDIFIATGAFMVAIVVSLAASWLYERRVPIMPLVTCVVVIIFGGLTFYFKDETFIKLKPTIIYALFALVLGGGLMVRRALLKPVLGLSVKLTDEGWNKLSLRVAVFFVFLAILNEIVWRSVSTDTWVNFKVFGFMPLTMLFFLAQMRLFARYQPDDEKAEAEA